MWETFAIKKWEINLIKLIFISQQLKITINNGQFNEKSSEELKNFTRNLRSIDKQYNQLKMFVKNEFLKSFWNVKYLCVFLSVGTFCTYKQYINYTLLSLL